MENLQSNRYNEENLAFFKSIVEKKLSKSEKQLANLEAQLVETSANKGSESDWVDDSSNSANLQLLDTMAHRLRKHIVDLKKALLRIENKSYGVCMITGGLIDKKRLMAVPTTTKSVAAKTSIKNRRPIKNNKPNIRKDAGPKILSKILSKSTSEKKQTPSTETDRWEETENLLEGVEQLDLKDEFED